MSNPDDSAGAYRKFTDAEIPPADFPVLVSMFSSQAAVALGMLPHPITKKNEQDLPVAQHFINMLGVLQDKTQGNLNDKERQFLDTTLHQLRIAFVQAKSKGAG